ncbi:transcription factor SOX-11-like isoform X1 [Sycon ciliatum]|uniref:transcription factor SOX-11-like isoform X1 n=2 Tax=Sycon ciliatum TaxID=27933 RepID=UPI0031F64549
MLPVGGSRNDPSRTSMAGGSPQLDDNLLILGQASHAELFSTERTIEKKELAASAGDDATQRQRQQSATAGKAVGDLAKAKHRSNVTSYSDQFTMKPEMETPDDCQYGVGSGRDMCSGSNARRIKRPMNSFLMWAKEARKRVSDEHADLDNAAISGLLGQLWKELPDSQKEPFILRADDVRQQHRHDHPSYYRHRQRKKPLTKDKIVNEKIHQVVQVVLDSKEFPPLMQVGAEAMGSNTGEAGAGETWDKSAQSDNARVTCPASRSKKLGRRQKSTSDSRGSNSTANKGGRRGNKNKRPTNAFLLWAQSSRPKLAKKFGELSNWQISMVLGELWKQAPVESKCGYHKLAEQLRNEHRASNPELYRHPERLAVCKLESAKAESSPGEDKMTAFALRVSTASCNGSSLRSSESMYLNSTPSVAEPATLALSAGSSMSSACSTMNTLASPASSSATALDYQRLLSADLLTDSELSHCLTDISASAVGSASPLDALLQAEDVSHFLQGLGSAKSESSLFSSSSSPIRPSGGIDDTAVLLPEPIWSAAQLTSIAPSLYAQSYMWPDLANTLMMDSWHPNTNPTAQHLWSAPAIPQDITMANGLHSPYLGFMPGLANPSTLSTGMQLPIFN